VGDLLAAKGRENGPVITASPKTTVREVVSTMKAKGFSQVPVMDGGKIVGIVHESDVLTHLLAEGATPSDPIEKLIVTDFAIVEPTNGLGLISQFFNQKKVVLVMDRGALSGIVTKIDFIDYVSKLT
jgi:cystathionine beta-synthase